MTHTLTYSLLATGLSAVLLAGCASDGAMDAATPQQMVADAAMPFGGSTDTQFAAELWQALRAANLVGAGAVQSRAYPGAHPHGAVLQNVAMPLTVAGTTGVVLVKTNYGGEGVSVEAVSANPARYLAAVTVMYKRPGYDPQNNDWFWAKYLPDGSLDKNPKGMMLAGRVAKGNTEAGCIACHSAAPGGDLVFTHDRFK